MIFRASESDPAARVLPDERRRGLRRARARAIGVSAGEGGDDAAPDQDGAPLDPQAAIRAERTASAGESFGIAGTIRNGVLAGLRQASFSWMMKHRARTVGEQGMHIFVADLQKACDASVHLMGHSFGCIADLVGPRRPRRKRRADSSGEFRGPRAGGDRRSGRTPRTSRSPTSRGISGS